MSGGETVVIVDDDSAVRDSLIILLESEGFTVMPFSSGRLLLEAALPRRGCMLLDVRMPDMDGLELQVRLHQKGSRLPVIIMTGHADVPVAVRAMKAGAIDFIEKPFAEEVILGSIRQALLRQSQVLAEEASLAEVQGRFASLTPREREVLEGLIAGRPNKVIGFQLDISPRTVEIHRARVMEKMQARSLSHLVRMALLAGLGTDAE